MRTRLVRAAVATAALATALSPLGTTAAPVCADEGRRARPDGWVSLNRPAWSIGDHKVTAWAASPYVDGYLLATNGSTIARSTDGGCGWEEVYTPGINVGENRLIGVGDSIYDVAMPPSPPGRVPYISYAVVSDLDSTVVATSSNLGETWIEQPSIGLPPLVALHSIHVAADPRTAYVLVDAQTSLTSVIETTLYVTRDAGLTFTPVKRGLDASQYTEIAVDPVIPTEIWAWDAAKLYHSKDSGLTFTEVRGIGGPISTVDITHFPAFTPAKVTAYRSDAPLARRSEDGGVTWKTVPTKGRVTGTTNLYTLDALATTSRTGVFVDVGLFKIRGLDVTPRNLVLHDLAFQLGGGLTTLYGSSGKDLYLRRFTPKLDPLPPINLRAPKVLKQGPTALLPANEVVKLVPGQRRTIDYRLDLSPVPTKLDVFFAMDSTGSMSPVIASLRKDLQDIIDDLGKSGINVWFGVGDFKDYPHFGAGADHPYKRFREVGPIDDELEEAINRITTGGGNGLDSALTATYQAATGEGQRRSDLLGDKGGWWVEPNQGAEWREDALKVLVIASDVRSRDPQNDAGYPGPTYRQVINALNHLGIEHVGLAVGDYPEEPYQSLRRVSSGTSTLAPADGTDCNDDGKVDVLPFQPMVCKLPLGSSGATNIAPAMVGLLQSLEDRQTVSFDLRGDRRVAAVEGLSSAMGVNVKTYNSLDFAVEVRCDLATSGQTYRYGIEAKVANETVAATGLTVECAGVAAAARRQRPEVREFAAPPVVRALVAAAAPPPPAPPAPVPQPQPQSNPNPNPQPGVQAQAGMAHQEQAEVQLALAEIDVHEDEELAMVGVADTDAARAGAVLCTGLAMSAGFAVAMRRRTRTSVARVRSSG
ncbi:MAG TPA: vWA domain-containing protein [Frankiaceae bacterium]|nr:vWA domain-containing protein [Frankiaceae bacterium]